MSTLTIHFLGTSAARPIPRWGCTCPQCTAVQTDARARRTRSAILVNGTLLVDAGPDIYAQLGTLPYEHLARIDHIIITHPHADHLAGLVEVLHRYKVKQVLAPEMDTDSPLHDEWLRVIADKSIKYTTARNGQGIALGTDVKEVLKPPVTLF